MKNSNVKNYKKVCLLHYFYTMSRLSRTGYLDVSFKWLRVRMRYATDMPARVSAELYATLRRERYRQVTCVCACVRRRG